MIKFIRANIFLNNPKSANAPFIFAVLIFYGIIISTYTLLFFGAQAMWIRIALSLVMAASFLIFEKSPLDGAATAFASPSFLVLVITVGAIYFKGDFLLFIYSLAAAMISLTYLKPKALLAYVAATATMFAALLFVFRINLLGASFSMVHNVLFFITTVAINVIIYMFDKSYALTLNALTEAKNEANGAAEAKGTFLSTMSHEIRTPMNAIIGMTNIGISARDAERKHYALCKIEDASSHLLGIINDVLDMSKIEAGKFELSMEDFNFEKTVRRVIDVMAFRIDEKKQQMKLYIDGNIPAVLKGDDMRLAQVIVNLLSNAVKFTPVGGAVSLAAHLAEEADGVYTVRMEVADSGIGISPEQQKRLFQSFQQAETGTSRKFGGTGLGLMISRNIIEMMGGRIWIESELGGGATFAFTFKMRRGDTEAYDLMVRETNWKNINILAVDENVGILGYLKKFTEDFGARCDSAVSGADAVMQAEQNPYDIYFVDLKMPDMDGFDLAGALRKIDPNRNKTVVIMISNAEWKDIEEKAKNAGVDRFLPKPLFPSAIADIINEFLGFVHSQVDEAAAGAPVLLEGRRILLAEDIEINREIIITLLEPTRVIIDCAENGAEAVRVFNESPDGYDAVLMDINMPEMDGYAATRRIRASAVKNAKTVPIIAMTADVFKEDVEKCIEAGMDDHIGKPVDVDELMDKLRKYV